MPLGGFGHLGRYQTISNNTDPNMRHVSWFGSPTRKGSCTKNVPPPTANAKREEPSSSQAPNPASLPAEPCAHLVEFGRLEARFPLLPLLSFQSPELEIEASGTAEF